MKHRGDITRWRRWRDKELVDLYFKTLRETNDKRRSVQEAVMSPCSRFWVDEYTAYNMVIAIMKGRCKNPSEMHKEIYRRVMAVINDNDNDNDNGGATGRIAQGKSKKKPLISIVFDVVRGGAPQFYLTEQSARRIIYWYLSKR